MEVPEGFRRHHLAVALFLLDPVSVQTTYKRDLCNVLIRSQQWYRPLERTSVALSVHSDSFILDERHDDVHLKDDDRDGHQECPDCGYHVRCVISLSVHIREHTSRHAPQSKEVLDQERHVEPDEEEPESDLTQSFIQHRIEHDRPEIMKACQ